jgi:hypothetical protein
MLRSLAPADRTLAGCVANMASYVVCSSLILAIHDK